MKSESANKIEMSPTPTANRSFLHGGGGSKAALVTEKVVYATLDSLALKRARLPLQLLPADNDNVERTEKTDRERRLVPGKTSPKRPTYKVRFLDRMWESRSRSSSSCREGIRSRLHYRAFS